MRQDARENRERILVAADRVFGAHGGAGSTEEVARIAGVGIATVFRHFPTKEALVAAALQRHFDELTDRATRLAAAPDAGAALRDLVRVMIESGATKLTLAAALLDGGGLPPGIGSASDRLQEAVKAALQRAQSAGEARPGVAVAEVYLLVRALAQATAVNGPPPEVLDRAIEIVLTGLSAPPPTTNRTAETS
jgi:AcrR family transcriptional regulator